MNDKSLRVLIIDDSEDDALLLVRELEKGGYNPFYERVDSPGAMQKSLKDSQWDIILCDYKTTNFCGPSAIASLKENNIDVPVIIVSAAVDEIMALECMRLGAKDYILKTNLSRLCPSVAREMEDAELRRKQRNAEDKLRAEEKWFRALVEHSSDIIVVLAPDATITYINPAVEQVLGFRPEERIGKKGLELVHPDDINLLAEKFITLVNDTNSPVIHWEMHLRHKNGNWHTLEAVGSNLVNNNVVEAVIVNYRDITDRKRAEEALRKSEEKYRELVKCAPAGIYEVDYETGYLISINDIFCEYSGYTREELLKMQYWDLFTEESQKYLIERLEKLHTGEAINIAPEYCFRTKGGEKLWIRLNARYIYENGKLKRAEGIIHNITERKLAEDALRESEQKYLELSMIDDLTQLYNSRHFYDQLKKEIERAKRYDQPLTLLLLDLDRFKAFNDKYGHIEGDNVLWRIGQIIKRCLREPDTAYRYGGEEFTIILPMTTGEEAVATAKRIRAELKKEAFSPEPGKEVYVTASIGLSQYKLNEEIKAFIHRVDLLMFQAKKKGRDKICHE